MTSRTVREALRHARSRGVVVSGRGQQLRSAVVPARSTTPAINVGGTTEHGCLGSYSNHGTGMDIVAPGGGFDAALHRRALPPGGRIPAATSRGELQAPARPSARRAAAATRHLVGGAARHRHRRAGARLGRARTEPDAARGRAPPRAHRARPRQARPRPLLRPARRDRATPPAAIGAASVVRMMSTEQGAWCETLFGTEPSRKRFAPVMPLLPTTMRSEPRSSATSRIASAGSPCAAKTSTRHARRVDVSAARERGLDVLAGVDDPVQVLGHDVDSRNRAPSRARTRRRARCARRSAARARSPGRTASRAVSDPSMPTTIELEHGARSYAAAPARARRFSTASMAAMMMPARTQTTTITCITIQMGCTQPSLKGSDPFRSGATFAVALRSDYLKGSDPFTPWRAARAPRRSRS